MGVITRIKANLSSTELGLTSQMELSLAKATTTPVSWLLLIKINLVLSFGWSASELSYLYQLILSLILCVNFAQLDKFVPGFENILTLQLSFRCKDIFKSYTDIYT